MKNRKIRRSLTVVNSFLFLAILGIHAIGMRENREWEAVSQKAESRKEEEIKPKIALTFDDGPHPVYTPLLLEGLRERGVKASFFLIGKNIEGNEEIVKQMAKQGNIVGNHTYNHVKVKALSPEQACEEMKKTSDLVEKITGETTCYIRPPFGEWDEKLDCGMDMISVMWTIDPLDWTTKNVSQVVNKVVTEAGENDIILLHDCYASSVEAAFQIIDQLQAEGFEFVTVEELILE
ncbi:MAG: polysaccharide deacetylase family protein [Eubacteriales bacterium]|nr:polysaccharide deacetylase family protein [Eubacteriales bacterium]